METAHHIDDKTSYDGRSSSHEPFVSGRPVDYLNGIHVSGRVLVPQLTRQLRELGIGAVTQQHLYVGTIRIRVGRREPRLYTKCTASGLRLEFRTLA